jgi:hypothetical protein
MIIKAYLELDDDFNLESGTLPSLAVFDIRVTVNLITTSASLDYPQDMRDWETFLIRRFCAGQDVAFLMLSVLDS